MSERNRLCIKREFCNDDCMTCTKAVKVELMSEIINGKVITRPNGIYRDKGRKGMIEAKENGRQCGHTGGRVEKLHSQKTP